MKGLRTISRWQKIALAVCAFLSCVSILAGVCLSEGKRAYGAGDQPEQTVIAHPYRDYEEISEVAFRAEASGNVYNGITTAAGLKRNLVVKARDINRNEYTLENSEYVIYYRTSEGTLVPLGDSAAIAVTGTTVDLIIRIVSGVEYELGAVPVAADPELAAINFTLKEGATFYDDYDADSIANILTVTDGTTEIPDRDLYNVSVEYTYTNEYQNVSAKVTVSLAGDSGKSAEQTFYDVKFATLQNVEISVKDEYTLVNGYYQTSNGYGVFFTGMSKQEVIEKLDIKAVYPNSKKLMKFTADSGTTDSGETVTFSPDLFTSNETVSVTLGDRGNASNTKSAQLSINFQTRAVAKIVVDQEMVNTILADKTVNPYTNFKDEGWLTPALRMIYSDGTDVDRDSTEWDSLEYGYLTPSASDIKACAGVSGSTYSKTIKVNYDVGVSANIYIPDILYCEPDGTGTAISGSFATQIMHRPFDFSNLTVRFDYPGAEILVPLSDFYIADDLEETKKYLSVTQYTDNGRTQIENETVITKFTKSVSVTFTYKNKKATKNGIINVRPEPIEVNMDRTPMSYAVEGCEKELILPEGATLPGVVEVGVYSDKECMASVDEKYYQLEGGKVTFYSGGNFYVGLKVIGDTADEYEFVIPNDSEVAANSSKSLLVFPIKINKGTLSLGVEYAANTWKYGETESQTVTVTGTVAGTEYTLIQEGTAGANELVVPYAFAYFKVESDGSVDWSNYASLSYEALVADKSHLEVGTYKVIAVTKETEAYLASKTRISNAPEITVDPAQISIDGLTNSIPYDRAAHSLDDFISTGTFPYEEKAADIFTIDGKTEFKFVRDSGNVTLSINNKNYEWSDGTTGNKTATVTITTKEFRFAVSFAKTEGYYGENDNPAEGSVTYTDHDPAYFSVRGVEWYSQKTGGTVIDLTTNPFNTWDAGTYYAYYTPTPITQEGETTEGTTPDFTVSATYATFTIKPAELTPVTIDGLNAESFTTLGDYNGTTGYTKTIGNYGNAVLNGAPGHNANEYFEVNVAYTPIVSEHTSSAADANGSITFVEAGEYVVTVKITDEASKNFKWNGIEDKEIVFKAKITPADVAYEPHILGAYKYNGAPNDVSVTTYYNGTASGSWENNLKGLVTFTVEGSTLAALTEPTVTVDQNTGEFAVTNAGKYTVTFTLSDKNNYQWYKWADSSRTTDDVEREFTVEQADLMVTWTLPQFEFDDTKEIQSAPQIAHVTAFPVDVEADRNALKVTERKYYSDISCEDKYYLENITKAGTFYVKITDFGVKDGYSLNKENYKINPENALSNVVIAFTVKSQELDTIVLIKGEYDDAEIDNATKTVSVFYKGAAYELSEFIQNFANHYNGKVDIKVDGDLELKNVLGGGYTVNVTPTGNYQWATGGNEAVPFTFVIKPKVIEFEWENLEFTYAKDTPRTPVIKSTNVFEGDDVKFAIAGTQTNAGVDYVATASISDGADKDNYTVVGSSTVTTKFTIKKLAIELPNAVYNENNNSFVATELTANYKTDGNAWNLHDATVSVAVSHIYNYSGATAVTTGEFEFDVATGAFTYLHAGVYTLVFKISDDDFNNYCWKEGIDDTKQTHTASVTVAQMELNVPALDSDRAIEFKVDKYAYEPNPEKLNGTISAKGFAIAYTKLYGIYSATDGYANAGPLSQFNETNSMSRNKPYFVELTVSDQTVNGVTASKYDFLWVENAADKASAESAYYMKEAGAPYGEAQYTSDGVRMYLCYVLTKQLVGAKFEFENYTYGDNGYDVAEANRRVLPEGKFDFADLESYGFTVSDDNVTDNGAYRGTLDVIRAEIANGHKVEVTITFGEDVTLVNGLPWNASKNNDAYSMHIVVTFETDSDCNTFNRDVEFTVYKRQVIVEWGSTASVEYDGEQHMRTATVKNPAKKTAEVTDNVTLKVQANDNGAWVDNVTDVPYSGTTRTTYTVKVVSASDADNYEITETNRESTFDITPAEVTLAGVAVDNHVYGQPLDRYNSNAYYTSIGIIESDKAESKHIVTVEIRVGSATGDLATKESPVGTNYFVVPKLTNEYGNYTLTSVTTASFAIVPRQITVTVNDSEITYGQDVDFSKVFSADVTNLPGGDGTGLGIPSWVKDYQTVFKLYITDADNVNYYGKDAGKYPVAGGYKVHMEEVDTDNYVITYDTEGNYKINEAAIVITDVTAYNGDYQGKDINVLSSKAATVQKNMDVTWYVKSVAEADKDTLPTDKNVDGWTLAESATVRNVTDSGWYFVIAVAPNHVSEIYGSAVEVVINKVNLTVTAAFDIYYSEGKPEDKNYLMGDADKIKDGHYSITGFVGDDVENETILNLSGTFGYKTTYEQGDPVNGTYYINFTENALESTNYTFGFEQGTLTVKALPVKVVVVSAPPKTVTYTENLTNYNQLISELNTSNGTGYGVETVKSTYGEDNIALTLEHSVIFGLDTEALIKATGGTPARTNDAGAYAIVVTFKDFDGKENYALSYEGADYTVNPAEDNEFTNHFNFKNGSVSDALATAGEAWIYGGYDAADANSITSKPQTAYKRNYGAAEGYNTISVTLSFSTDGSAWEDLKTIVATWGEGGYDISELFTGAAEFKAGIYRLSFEMTGNANYNGIPNEKHYFKVAKKAVAINPEDVTLTYGTAKSGEYEYNDEVFVLGQTSDSLKLEFTFDSAYDHRDNNRFYKAQGYEIAVKNVTVDGSAVDLTDYTCQLDNYVVTFGTATLMVNPLEIAIEIIDKESFYNLKTATLNGEQVEDREDAEKLYFKITSDNNIYIFDLANPEANLELNTNYVYNVQNVFTLNTEALDSVDGHNTNNAKDYPIYAVFTNENYKNSYSITIKGSTKHTDNDAILNEDDSANAGTYLIKKAALNLTAVKKFYYVDNDPTKEKVVYQNNTAAERYDGKQKHYVSAIEDATITGVNMTVEYYEGKATGSDISGLTLLGTEADNKAPKDAGGYTVRYTFSEHQNYEPANAIVTFDIVPVTLTVVHTTSDEVIYTQHHYYTGKVIYNQLTFSTLVDGEVLEGLKVVESGKTANCVFPSEDEPNVFKYGESDAGTYSITLDFSGVKNYVLSGHEKDGLYNFSYTITKRELTVTPDNISVAYGTSAEDAKDMITAKYGLTALTIEGVTEDTETLLAKEIAAGRLTALNEIGFNISTYSHTSEVTSETVPAHVITIDEATVTATNFVIKVKEGELTVIPREIVINVNGFDDNGNATSLYTGNEHQGTLTGMLGANPEKFLYIAEADRADAFGANYNDTEASYIANLKSLDVSLTIANAILVGRYGMRPSCDNGNYSVTFKHGDDVINNLDSSSNLLPKYYVSPVQLDVTVVHGGTNNFTVQYGDKAEYGTYYTLQYTNFVNNEDPLRKVQLEVSYSTEYVPWRSIAGDEITITPIIEDSEGNQIQVFDNYTLNAVPATMKVTPRIVTATADDNVYTPCEDGTNGGIYGQAREAHITFDGAGSDVYYNLVETYVYNTVDDTSYNQVRGAAPTRAGDDYTVTIEFAANANGSYNYNFATDMKGYNSPTQATLDYRVKKLGVSVALTHTYYTLNNEEYFTAVTGYIADVMKPDRFVWVNGNEGGTATNYKNEDGFQFIPNKIGSYTLEVMIKDGAQNNYEWLSGGNSVILAFRVFADEQGIVHIDTVEIDDWIYGQLANNPSWTLNPAGSPGTVTYDFARANLSITDTPTDRNITSEEVTGLEDSGYDITPANVGWYILRVNYVGLNNDDVAYYLFRITHATVEAPKYTFVESGNNQNSTYNSNRLTLVVNYGTNELAMDYPYEWSPRADGANLFATNAGEYKATFGLVNSANYKWADGVELDGNGNYVLTWTVKPAKNNNVGWNNPDITVTYGNAYVPSAYSNYGTAVITYFYATREKGEEAPANDAVWSRTPAFDSGLYWIKAVSSSPATPINFEEKESVTTLTIAKRALSLSVTGTLKYGGTFADATFAYRFSGMITGDSVDRGTAVPVLKDTALNKDQLGAGSHALTFAAADEKENGVDVVKGFSSKNYYLAIDNVSGYINVSKRSLTIQIGSSSSIYSDEVDYTDAYKNIVIVGGDGLTTWDAAALAELGGSYEDLLDIMLYTSATRTSNVGSYTISVQSYDEANYDISFYSGVHTIERMEISVDIAQGGGTYGDPDDQFVGAVVTRVYRIDTNENVTADIDFDYIYIGVSNDGKWNSSDASIDNTVIPKRAGTYTATVVNSANRNYVLVGTFSVPYVVNKQEINAGDGNITVASQKYTGSPLTPVVTSKLGDDFFEVVETDTEYVNVGAYTVTLRMKDFHNMKWRSVDVSDREIPFVIEKAKNELTSEISINGWTYGRYDAGENTPSATVRFGNDEILFTYSTSENGTFTSGAPRNDKAGTYWVRVTVLGTDNYDRFDSPAVSFRISPVVLDAPQLTLITEGEGKNDTFTGSDLVSRIIGFDTSTMSIAYDGRISVIGNTVAVYAFYTGEYIVTISLNDNENYVWAEGTTVNDDNGAVLTWSIARKKVAKPTDNNRTMMVNGKILEYFPNGFDETIMDITGNKSGYGGTFQAYVSLKDTQNYMWEDGTDDPLPPFTWKVVGTNTLFAIIAGTLGGASAVAAVVATVLFVQYRKKKRIEAEGPQDDGTETGAEPEKEENETKENEGEVNDNDAE